MPEVDKMTRSVKKDFDQKKPSASENSPKSSMGKKEITKNVGHAKLFKNVQKLSQNAEEAKCEWYTEPKKGDPNFKAILELMGQNDKAKRIKAKIGDHQAVIKILGEGLDDKATDVRKPANDKYSKVEGQEEGKDERALAEEEDRFSNSNSTRKNQNQQQSMQSSSSKSKWKKAKAKTTKKRSCFFCSTKKKATTKKKSSHHGWFFGLVQTQKNTSSEVLHTGEIVSSDTKVVTKDGFAFCLIPFLGWGFCSIVAFLVMMYLFVMFVACFYAMMVFILPLWGMMFCGMLAFVNLLWKLFKAALTGHWEPDRIGILDSCMPYFTWPLTNTGNEKWVALLTCAFGSMR